MKNLLFTSLILLFLGMPALAADIKDFVGRYAGSAIIGEQVEERDMSVVIENSDKGFLLTWKSVQHKADGQLSEKEYSLHFLPTNRDQIFASAMATNVFGNPVQLDPMQGDPYVWARIKGDTLSVFSLIIDENGGYEVQEYHRTLKDGGLDLEYRRVRNGERLKNITAFLKRQ